MHGMRYLPGNYVEISCKTGNYHGKMGPLRCQANIMAQAWNSLPAVGYDSDEIVRSSPNQVGVFSSLLVCAEKYCAKKVILDYDV